MQIQLNKEGIRHHFSYHWWKYAILILASVFGWNLIYTMTAYRPPAEKTVHLYSDCFYDAQPMISWLQEACKTEVPDAEDVTCITLMNDTYYGSIQLGTYIMSGSGGYYLLSPDSFQSYAASGAFVPLDDKEEVQQAIADTGIDAEKGIRTETETFERHLYGIPVKELPGLLDIGISRDDAYLAISVTSGNEDNLLHLLAVIIREMSHTN